MLLFPVIGNFLVALYDFSNYNNKLRTIAAVQQDGIALQFASEELQGNPEVVSLRCYTRCWGRGSSEICTALRQAIKEGYRGCYYFVHVACTNILIERLRKLHPIPL